MFAPCHLEIAADDTERGRKFYADAFNWKFKLWEGGSMEYWGIDVGNDHKPFTVMGMGFMKRMSPDQKVTMYIDVKDITTHSKKVVECGGKLVGEKTTVGDMGWFQTFYDTENNMVALWQNNPDYKPQPC